MKIIKIGVYKIGEQWYNEKVDRNSGLHESKMIKDKLNKAYGDVINLNDSILSRYHGLSIEKLILIGGYYRNELEIHNVRRLMSISKKTIFVMTDIDCLHLCPEEIENSDVILTQSPVIIPEISHKQQRYSYVPELFFDPDFKAPFKTNCVLFGGTIESREDDAAKYLFKHGYIENALNDRMLMISRVNGKDSRLEYSQYINLLSHFKYSLIISHEKCRDIGWVTARYIESISCHTIPLVDRKYDKFEHFIPINDAFRVDTYEDIIKRIITFDNRKIDMLLEPDYARLREDNNKFVELIAKL